MKGVIFDIQSYAIHDGPGIRTCIFFKGCPLRCAWCHNPESQSSKVEVAYRQNRCAGCGRCVQACPHQALRLEEGGAVRREPRSCIACGKCVEACPNDAMERIGYPIEAGEVARLVSQDKPFYDDSGGGATLTGGEPTAQPAFLFEVLGELRKRGIHTALETCGHFNEKLVDPLVGAVDLFLFDVKHLSDQKHKQATGAGNQRILENFRAVVDRAGEKRVIVRIPVIPGFNADPDSIASTAAFLADSKWGGQVQLLAHHAWAQDKYRMLGREAPGIAAGSISARQRDEIFSTYVEHGLTPIWS